MSPFIDFILALDPFHRHSTRYEHALLTKRTLTGMVFGVGMQAFSSMIFSSLTHSNRDPSMDYLPRDARLHPPVRRSRNTDPAHPVETNQTRPLAPSLLRLHLGVRHSLDAGHSHLVCLQVHRMGRHCLLHLQHVCVCNPVPEHPNHRRYSLT